MFFLNLFVKSTLFLSFELDPQIESYVIKKGYGINVN